MRAKGKADLSHILPSIRARGVLVPPIVRPTEEAERFEIVAGQRRYHAALAVAEESGEAEPLPCAIMAPGDDAATLEASLIENVARRAPDEVTLWESFMRLVREGRSPEDIALTFGLTELDHLPERQQRELARARDILLEEFNKAIATATQSNRRQGRSIR